MWFLIVSLAFGVSLGLSYRLLSPSFLYIPDYPNARSLHSMPVPRTGGIAITFAIFIAVAFTAALFGMPNEFLWVLASLLLLVGISFWDDKHNIAPEYRLITQIIASVLLVAGGFVITDIDFPGIHIEIPLWLGIPLSILFAVWMTNLYNFMDGMDGFAGGMAVIGFGALAVQGWFADHMLFSAMSAVVAAASAGFLVFNFPPARIFMGDTGSTTLGFLVAVFSLWGRHELIFPLWLPALIFSPFIVDATWTLLRRVLKGENLLRAHCSHFYQRAVKLGLGHKKTVLVQYTLMLGCAITGIWSLEYDRWIQWGMLAFWTLSYLALMLFIKKSEIKQSKPVSCN